MTTSSTPSRRLTIWFFIISLLLLIFVGLYLHSLSNNLITRHAPKGIISYELCFMEDEIKQDWLEKNVTGIAVRQTLWDFLFIALYSLVMWQALLFTHRIIDDRYQIQKWWLPSGRIIIIAAALMDVLENAVILYSLYNDDYFPWLIHIPAYIKFSLILLFSLAIVIAVIRWLIAKL